MGRRMANTRRSHADRSSRSSKSRRRLPGDDKNNPKRFNQERSKKAARQSPSKIIPTRMGQTKRTTASTNRRNNNSRRIMHIPTHRNQKQPPGSTAHPTLRNIKNIISITKEVLLAGDEKRHR